MLFTSACILSATQAEPLRQAPQRVRRRLATFASEASVRAPPVSCFLESLERVAREELPRSGCSSAQPAQTAKQGEITSATASGSAHILGLCLYLPCTTIMSTAETSKSAGKVKAKEKDKDKKSKASSSGQKAQGERLKTVVRRLPPNLPEEIFWQSVAPWVTDETASWRVYYPGKFKTKCVSISVCCRSRERGASVNAAAGSTRRTSPRVRTSPSRTKALLRRSVGSTMDTSSGTRPVREPVLVPLNAVAHTPQGTSLSRSLSLRRSRRCRRIRRSQTRGLAR